MISERISDNLPPQLTIHLICAELIFSVDNLSVIFLITLIYIFKCTVVNLYMCIYVHTDTEGLMED